MKCGSTWGRCWTASRSGGRSATAQAARTTRAVLSISVGINLIVALLLILFTVRQLTGLSRSYGGALFSIRRQAEAARESEERFRTIFEQAPVALAQLDVEGHLLRFNQQLSEISGKPRGQLEQMVIWDLIHPEERQSARERWQALVAGNGHALVEERRYVRTDGSVARVGVTAARVRGSGGRDSIIAIIEDLRARRFLEGPLRKLGVRFRLAADAIGIGTWDLDLESRQVVWSERQETLFGLGPGSFEGTHEAFLGRVRAQDRGAIEAAEREAIEQRTVYQVEYCMTRGDGAIRRLCDSGQVIADPSGKATHIIGITVDITERAEAHDRGAGDISETA